MKVYIVRIVVDIALLLAVFILPWWFWLVCVAVSVFIIDRQYEIIGIAFLADAAYSAGAVDFKILFLGLSAALLIISILLRPRLNIYDKYFF